MIQAICVSDQSVLVLDQLHTHHAEQSSAPGSTSLPACLQGERVKATPRLSEKL